jgi:hypothetical protein
MRNTQASALDIDELCLVDKGGHSLYQQLPNPQKGFGVLRSRTKNPLGLRSKPL